MENITREQFMEAFRDDEWLKNNLSVDDRIEIWKTILPGSSDVTKENLDSLIKDYCVENLQVVDTSKIPLSESDIMSLLETYEPPFGFDGCDVNSEENIGDGSREICLCFEGVEDMIDMEVHPNPYEEHFNAWCKKNDLNYSGMYYDDDSITLEVTAFV
jgi:hypothetical protein